MTDQTVNLATRIFFYVFLDYQALFAFNNTVNHVYFTKNPLLTQKIYLGINKK